MREGVPEGRECNPRSASSAGGAFEYGRFCDAVDAAFGSFKDLEKKPDFGACGGVGWWRCALEPLLSRAAIDATASLAGKPRATFGVPDLDEDAAAAVVDKVRACVCVCVRASARTAHAVWCTACGGWCTQRAARRCDPSLRRAGSS